MLWDTYWGSVDNNGVEVPKGISKEVRLKWQGLLWAKYVPVCLGIVCPVVLPISPQYLYQSLTYLGNNNRTIVSSNCLGHTETRENFF